MSRFKPASRKQSRLRFGIDGPSGSGKSFTALRFAFSFKGAKVAAIEAGENGGLELYKGQAPDGVPFDFDILHLTKNFAPTEYAAAIEEAGREGYDVLVIDSLSHAWAGEGGALDIKDRQGGNEFAAWRNVTPMHNRMIDAILQSPCHVFATLRSKTEYVLEANERGRMVPRKVGLAPVQRAGMEYEFTIYGSMDQANILTITKSRFSPAQNAIVSKPGASFMHPIITWLETGEVIEMPQIQKLATPETVTEIAALLAELKVPVDKVRDGLRQYGVTEIAHLKADQAEELRGKLQQKIDAKKTTTPQA